MRVVALAVIIGIVACGPSNPYRPATDAERAAVLSAVNDYYAARSGLSADLSVDEFWRRYPELERKLDVGSGINIEAFWARHWHAEGESNYRVELEHYEPVHVWLRGTSAMARVHGLEYLALHVAGETIGEFHTVITLERRDDRWEIVQTDEQMLGERPPTDPPTR
jgi:hypothetical protein